MTEAPPDQTDLQRALEQLQILNRISVELARKLDLNYVLQLALDAAVRLSLASDAFIALMVDGQLEPAHAIGRFPHQQTEVYLLKQAGIVGRVIRQKRGELVMDVNQDPDYKTVIPDTVAQITLPLQTRSHFLGILNLETKHAERFTPATFESLKLLATHISLAIENAQVFAETERLVQELDAFAHTVAHDLKNPLNTMIGYATMLADDYEQLGVDERSEFAERIVMASEQMAGIIDALLLLASIRKQSEVPMQALDMGEVVAAVLRRLERLIKDMDARISLPKTWLVGQGYAPWVEEIWANYISNAVKYGGRPPRVEMGSIRQHDGMIRFWVRDNGQGLTKEEQVRLFTPFTRLGQVQVKGHGLGLSIVRRIVERLGGRVGVDSELNQGSLFYFTLPEFMQAEQ